MSKLDDLYDKALKAARESKPRRSKSYGGRASLDVPGKGKRYYVVIGFHGKTIPQIAEGVLPGVRGISSCKEVVPLWLTVGRDAVIVMNAASARRLNDLIEIEYDNPDSLLADGMAILHRLYDKKQTPGGGQQVMLRLVDEMKGGFEKVPGLVEKIEANEVRYFDGRSLSEQSSVLSFAYMRYLEGGGEPMSSVDQVARWLHEQAPEVIRGWNLRQGLKLMTVSDWKYLVRYAAKSLGARYEEECEVLVKDEILRVPKGSYLYVVPGGHEEKREALVEKWLPQLEEHYAKIFIVNPSERARARAMGIVHKRSFDSRKARGLL